MSIRQVLSHDVLSASPLFDGDLPAHVSKSKLVSEIKPHLDLTQWSPKSTYATHVVVDFISKIRQMPLAQFPNFRCCHRCHHQLNIIPLPRAGVHPSCNRFLHRDVPEGMGAHAA